MNEKAAIIVMGENHVLSNKLYLLSCAKNINMIFHCIWRGDWWTHNFFFLSFHVSHKICSFSPWFLYWAFQNWKHLQNLKSLKTKKKREGLFLWGIFLKVEGNFCICFCGFFPPSFFLEYLIQFQKKTREFITDYCDNTLITVNYRVLKCLFITMSLLI